MDDDRSGDGHVRRADGGHEHEGHEHDEEGHGDHHDHGHHHGEAGTHDHHHHDVEQLSVAVVTVSSTREASEDVAGDAIEEELRAAGNDVASRVVVPDDAAAVREAVQEAVGDDAVDAVVTTGGTGVTPDDVTVEAVEELFAKHLPGFGELFRDFSREEVGTRVVGTRATAGIVTREDGGVPVFSLPGSENAARLGTRDVIVPEAPHLAGLARR
ncbi:MogA/MoaB family molybdenum cofactor biosynthesis protein [Halomarina rubra]|uniref:Molybdenum cofactor biosynthesis protein B n=1 Tax=Halomarina rubra TaxID=2071873 RepID=A0ABD6AYA6_9EURY|nr:MogA/MoaB family molybdenum cofactor biosynthesis protein [Halomarina rubra]